MADNMQSTQQWLSATEQRNLQKRADARDLTLRATAIAG